MGFLEWLLDKTLPTKLRQLINEDFTFLLLQGAFVGIILVIVIYGAFQVALLPSRTPIDFKF
jgi:hypothetical protein